MSPLVIAAAAGLGLYLLTRGAKKSAVTGPSGKQWEYVSTAKPELGLTVTTVGVKAGQFGAHVEMPVLTFSVPAGATGPRTLMGWNSQASEVMLTTAAKDFNVTVPAGLGFPKVSGRRY